MANPDKAALGRQIGADPRVQAYIRERQRGSMPVVLNASVLQSFGYQVPPDWKYQSASARLPAHLYDDHDAWDTGLIAAGGGLLGAGVLGAAGVGPLAAPGAAEAGSAAGAGGAAAAQGATAAATKGLGGQALDFLKDPKNALGLASLLPLLLGGGNNSSAFGNQAALNDEMGKSLAQQRQRVEQTQPVFDTLVNMAYGGTPTRYRGAAPSGYPQSAQEPVSGPYKYDSPRFK